MKLNKIFLSIPLICSISFAEQTAFDYPPEDLEPEILAQIQKNSFLNKYDNDYSINNSLLRFSEEETFRHLEELNNIKENWEKNKEEYFEILGKFSKKTPHGFSNLRLNIDDIIVKLEETFSRIYIFNFDLYSSNRNLDFKLVEHLDSFPSLKYFIILKSIFPSDNDFKKEEFSDVFFDFERLGGVIDKLVQDGTKDIKDPEEKWLKMKTIINDFVYRMLDYFEKPFEESDDKIVTLLTKVAVKIDNNPNVSEEDKREIVFRLKQVHNFLSNVNPWAISIIPYGENEGPEGTH